ncbi:MAG: uncharacterized protein QG565_295 [Campylobacterota bacterium]|nr:uncharacterized protein [Campylobacterota bacterium]MDQ1267885.1 uncharacterized protein [Campylobacterota bacterium]
MSKRKKTATKKHPNIVGKIAWSLAFVMVVLASVAIGYYIGYDDAKDEIAKKEHAKEQKKLSMVKKLEDEKVKKDEQSVSSRLKEVLKKESKPEESKPEESKPEESKPSAQAKLPKVDAEPVGEYEDASHELEDSVPPVAPKREIVKTSARPKLAIIIDDVSIASHVNAIKGLNLPITMSFLPPSKSRPNSHALASKENFYMVHLPMEAQNFTKEEPFTLKIGDSQEKISQRIDELKKLFPKVGFINNHTGSKFTADESAMNRLLFSLKSQNIAFIDSRTTADSKAQKASKKYGLNYVGRDIFLDHKMDKPYIKAQIKKAIEVAKSHGSAIAIGHPHANTILAINESKALFGDVDLVLVDKL